MAPIGPAKQQGYVHTWRTFFCVFVEEATHAAATAGSVIFIVGGRGLDRCKTQRSSVVVVVVEVARYSLDSDRFVV